MTTYGELAAQLGDCGLLPGDSARIAYEELERRDLLEVELTPDDAGSALEEFGVAVAVHTDDVDDLGEAYRTIIEEAAALGRGAVVVSGIQLIQQGDDETVSFELNGRSVTWTVEHDDPEYLDTLAIAEHINDLAPSGDPRSFYECDGDDLGATYYVLADPDQIAVLGGALGLTFISMA